MNTSLVFGQVNKLLICPARFILHLSVLRNLKYSALILFKSLFLHELSTQNNPCTMSIRLMIFHITVVSLTMAHLIVNLPTAILPKVCSPNQPLTKKLLT